MQALSNRSSLVMAIVAVLAAGLVAGCTSNPRQGSPRPESGPPATALERLAFGNLERDPCSVEFLGTEDDGASTRTSFDPVSFPAVMHARTLTAANFALEGKPVQPRPTEIVVFANTVTAKLSSSVHAQAGRFLAAVDASVFEGNLKVVGVQDDRTQVVGRATAK